MYVCIMYVCIYCGLDCRSLMILWNSVSNYQATINLPLALTQSRKKLRILPFPSYDFMQSGRNIPTFRRNVGTIVLYHTALRRITTRTIMAVGTLCTEHYVRTSRTPQIYIFFCQHLFQFCVSCFINFAGQHSQYSCILDYPRFEFRQGQEIFPFSKLPKLTLGSTQPPAQWTSKVLPSGVKGAGA